LQKFIHIFAAKVALNIYFTKVFFKLFYIGRKSFSSEMFLIFLKIFSFKYFLIKVSPISPNIFLEKFLQKIL